MRTWAGVRLVVMNRVSWSTTLSGFVLLAATCPWSASRRFRASVTGNCATVIVEVGAGVLDLSLHPPGSGDVDALMSAIDLFGRKVLPHIREV